MCRRYGPHSPLCRFCNQEDSLTMAKGTPSLTGLRWSELPAFQYSVCEASTCFTTSVKPSVGYALRHRASLQRTQSKVLEGMRSVSEQTIMTLENAPYSQLTTFLLSGGNDEVDGNTPKRPRQRRKSNEEYINAKGGNTGATLLKTSVAFLFQPVPIPSIIPNTGVRNHGSVPLVYILSTGLLFWAMPHVTWGLYAFFFAAYLLLGMVLSDDEYGGDCTSDDLYNQNDDDDNNNENGVVSLASFAGALASAALVSPQGLTQQDTTFYVTFPVAIVALVLAGLAILGGTSDLAKKEELWEEDDARQRVVNNERREMDKWDEVIERTFKSHDEYN